MSQTQLSVSGSNPAAAYADNGDKSNNVGSPNENSVSKSDAQSGIAHNESVDGGVGAGSVCLYSRDSGGGSLIDSPSIRRRMSTFGSISNMAITNGMPNLNLNITPPLTPMSQRLHSPPASPLMSASMSSSPAFSSQSPPLRPASVVPTHVGPAPDGDKASVKQAPVAPPKNRKMLALYNRVGTRLNVSNLDQNNNAEHKRLKESIDEYHTGLDKLQENISDLKPEEKSKKQAAADSDTGAEELRELRAHLEGLKQLNKSLSTTVKPGHLPGGDAQFQAWQDSLQDHAAAFDELIGLIQLIIEGKYHALLDDEEKKK